MSGKEILSQLWKLDNLRSLAKLGWKCLPVLEVIGRRSHGDLGKFMEREDTLVTSVIQHVQWNLLSESLVLEGPSCLTYGLSRNVWPDTVQEGMLDEVGLLFSQARLFVSSQKSPSTAISNES